MKKVATPPPLRPNFSGLSYPTFGGTPIFPIKLSAKDVKEIDYPDAQGQLLLRFYATGKSKGVATTPLG